MKKCDLTAIFLAGLLTVGSVNAQTAPTGTDPHHPAPDPGAPIAAEAIEAPAPEAPAPGAAMVGMMSPDMMQMMMQMMAQHHPAGQMPMPGMSGGMQPGMGGSAGMSSGSEPGPEAIFGLAPSTTVEMTPELVRTWLQARLDSLGNPRLALGDISTASDGSIIAEIRTVDGALVQKLAFNHFPGFVRQIE